ncbi:hypothetical protein HK405_002865, partial [Cladochytrium tenue]
MDASLDNSLGRTAVDYHPAVAHHTAPAGTAGPGPGSETNKSYREAAAIDTRGALRRRIQQALERSAADAANDTSPTSITTPTPPSPVPAGLSAH